MPKAATQARATGSKATARPAPGWLASRPFAAQRGRELQKTERGEQTNVSAGPSFSFGKLSLQPKLTIGRTDDPFEHEADRVAEQVIRMPDPELSVASAPTQLNRRCAACEEEAPTQTLQTNPAGTSKASASEAPGIVHEVLRSPGQPLDEPTRAFFEPRFGRSFSDVRVHTDANAAASARAVNALAYTVGNDLVFSEGRYTPSTNAGRRLLGHELTHTIQQGAATRLGTGGQEAQGLEDGRAVIQRQADSVTGTNPYAVTALEVVWKQGFDDGFAQPEEDHPTPSPLSTEEQAVYSEGVLAGKNAARPGTPAGSTEPPSTTAAPAGPPTTSQEPPGGAPETATPAPIADQTPVSGGPSAAEAPDACKFVKVRSRAARDLIQVEKERFVDDHLPDAQKGAAELGIPVENILGLSALESAWGTHHFATDGGNYFGLNYPATYATGFMHARESKARMATYASYADGLASFIADKGSSVKGESDPKAFAEACQRKGKFGIETKKEKKGENVPSYVDDLLNTICGLRPIVKRKASLTIPPLR